MIEKQNDLIVPKGIRYISQWREFQFSNFPAKCIINKVLPGCGFTEYCLTGSENVILTSPRKLLLENKYEQHLGDTFLVINELDPETDIDKNLERTVKIGHSVVPVVDEDPNLSEDEIKAKKRQVLTKLEGELKGYIQKMSVERRPMKILVTYDSYRVIKDILTGFRLFDRFYTVVDEFQTILHDSRFKSDTELSFLGHLRTSHSALFVSATPMLEEYLNMLDEFSGLPYIKLDWSRDDPGRVRKPDLKVLAMMSVNTKIREVIDRYLAGDYEKVTVIGEDGQLKEVVSDEAVFYLNSVNHIVNIIRKNGLQPEQVNILCSNTEANATRVWKKLGKGFNIGRVPLRGERPKMFTFCTRTVYLGADFYSTCARSFIFSDSNIETLAVDISEDLPQILGRQRLDENPWKNTATFFYKSTCDPRKVSQEVFDRLIENKRKVTENLLSAFDTAKDEAKDDLARNYQKVAKSYNYRDDYVAVNVVEGGIKKPLLNNLVLVNEIRAYKIQQIDYKDRFSVFTALGSVGRSGNITGPAMELDSFVREYNRIPDFRGRLRYLCESELADSDREMFLGQLSDSNKIKSYYLVLGPERLRALNYQRDRIEKECQTMLFNQGTIDRYFLGVFTIGDRIGLADLKAKIGEYYQDIGYSATARAIEITRYFDVKPIKIFKGDVRVHGYELLSVRPGYLEQYNNLHHRN